MAPSCVLITVTYRNSPGVAQGGRASADLEDASGAALPLDLNGGGLCPGTGLSGPGGDSP